MSYEEAQSHVIEGERLLCLGEQSRAGDEFRRAARIYTDFIQSLPADRVRTRAAYGCDAAELLCRAGDLDEAERLTHRLLGERGIDPYPKRELEELLARIWRARRQSDALVTRTAAR